MTTSRPFSEKRPAGKFLNACLNDGGLKKSEVVQRWGYANLGKGLRRLEQVAEGTFVPDRKSLSDLAKALKVPEAHLISTIASTQELLELEEEAARLAEWQDWCANFQPHAIWRTERRVPSQIFIVALVGAESLLRLDFDFTPPESSWVERVCEKLPSAVPCFGEVTGFFINYTPYRAVEFDRTGVPERELSEARRPGRASILHKGRDTTNGWRAVLGWR